MKISLAVKPWGQEEIAEAIDSLQGTLTMGEKVAQFERDFAKYLDVKHAIMVNSGSSANLLALSVLKLFYGGGEVITPAITWATTISPLIQLGFEPVLVDVGLDGNIDPERVSAAFTERTVGILPVHLLGNPAKIDELEDLAEWSGVWVMEDACEAHGATVDTQKVGTFGDMGTFSFYFSHHISTIEGGMIVTNNDAMAMSLRAERAFGWIRDLPIGVQANIRQMYPTLDPRFLFIETGYNFRPTEIQGAFGIRQLPKLETVIEKRISNAKYLSQRLGDSGLVLPETRENTRHVFLGYSVLDTRGRNKLVAHLASKEIDTRPIMTGDVTRQPFMFYHQSTMKGPLTNTQRIDREGVFLPIHQGLGKVELDYLADSILELQ